MIKYILLSIFFITSLFSQTNNDVKSSIKYFEQKDITKSIDITKEKFSLYDSKKSNFGFTKSIYWLKIDIKNLSNETTKNALVIPYNLLDYIDIFQLKNNHLTLKRQFGDLREYKNDGSLPDPTFVVSLKPNESKVFFYKIQTQGSMNIELNIKSYKEFENYSLEKSIILSFYFGAIFIMLIYNFILYLMIKDKSYLYYLLFHIDYLFFTLSLNGISAAYIWPTVPFINSFAIVVLMSIGSSLAVIFTIEFLNIKKQSPKLYKLLMGLFWINVVMTFSIIFLGYHISSMLTSLVSLISILIILPSSIYSHFVSKNPNAKFFALAWGILLIGIFIIHFRNIGVLPVNVFTSYSPLIGAFMELTLLSIALAYRYNIQKQQIAIKDNILEKQSRHASMGEMISNIAHQWRQPINRINLSLEVIEEIIKDDKIDNPIINKRIDNSKKNIQYMSQTIDDFSNFFSPNKSKNKFNIYETINKALNLLQSRTSNITIDLKIDKEINFYGFENEFVQILLVILNNAIDNFELTNQKEKNINIVTKKENDNISISICDNGGGISKENINYIFDPYFTTKFKTQGTGIGLYMAKTLIETSMNGKLNVTSNKGKTTFIINF